MLLSLCTTKDTFGIAKITVTCCVSSLNKKESKILKAEFKEK